MKLGWRMGAAVALAAGLLVSGCSTVQSRVSAEVEPGLVAEIAPSGRLRAAINLGNVVLAQRGGPRGVRGPSVDIAEELARELRVPLDLVVYEAAGEVVSAVQRGEWDVAFLAVDPARAEVISFTRPYVFIDGTYLVRESSPYREPADLDRPGVRIAVGQGAAYDLFLTRTLEHATLVRAPTSAAAIELFLSDGLDAAAGVRESLVQAEANLSGYRVLAGSFNRIEQAVAVPAGRERSYAFVGSVIDKLKNSGSIREALDRAGQSGAVVAP